MGNLRAARRCRQLVADGLRRPTPAAGGRRSTASTRIGRPSIWPESALDHRSDIFSIGAVLYEMATGEQAFPGDTPSRIAAAIVSGTPPPADARNPRWPPWSRSCTRRWRRLLKTATRAPRTCSSDLRRLRRRVETSAGDTSTAGPLRRRLLLGRGCGRCSSPRWQPAGGGAGSTRSRLSSGTPS